MALDEEKIKGILKEKGLKVTRQRLVVLNALASKPDSHLTAEEIYDLVKTDSPEIGLATVYRTIPVSYTHLLQEARVGVRPFGRTENRQESLGCRAACEKQPGRAG